MPSALPSALIDCQTLSRNLANPSLRLVDASFPAIPDFHAKARIGDAVLFDIEAISDHTNPLPHMLPAAADFAKAVGDLGISNDDDIVIYDQSGMVMAAARAWWMFRVFGHRTVRILNGGMPLWHAQGLPINFAAPKTPAPTTYTAGLESQLVASRQQILGALGNDRVAILDARAEERFTGNGAEFRPGLKAGHIPGSYSLPYHTLIKQPEGSLIDNDPRVTALIQAAPDQIITSCGSGITACVLALALYESGYKNAAVYDGSWSEWALDSLNLPIEQGVGKNFPNERK